MSMETTDMPQLRIIETIMMLQFLLALVALAGLELLTLTSLFHEAA